MKELFLSNTGTSLVPVEEDGEVALASYPKGQVLRVKITQTRSYPHHNFFFAFLREAFEHWPADHGFKPRDYQYHLRGWLTVKAGFHEQLILRPRTVREANFAVEALKLAVKGIVGDRPFWSKISQDAEGGMIDVRWPMSIEFEKMDQEEFQRLTTLVFTVIYAETEIDVEDYYERWKGKNGGLSVAPARDTAKPYRKAARDDFPS